MQQKLTFKNKDGESLSGIISINNEKSKDIVIISHGFSSSKDRTKYSDLQTELDKIGINSLRIDLWGHGESDGDLEKITVEKGVESIIAAVNFTKEQGFENIHLLGFSYGGYCTAIAAETVKPKSMILISSVTDYPKNFLHELGQDKIDDWKEKGYRIRTNSKGITSKIGYQLYESTLKYDLFEISKKLICPTLLIHGDADTEVPKGNSINISKTLPNNKLVIIEGAGHKYEDKLEQLFQEILKFSGI